ncbi:undecaprenyl-diphosphate phosphatase [Shimazuella sp. AN120528]|uniref:undecaprenyl-diphosphate phosphatase n=1 Tax=Shimazuella soli TaxID=1892854 RepID=UPI001F0D5335|nr:undecaprenyl-diphosphate phosphatase [Shimazuella soli]MCH5583505.1 undecaprenyl-diphosphate phosphatase [Shimazuella soli]
MWEIFCGFILGMVEGLTEFAPVSSTGHMILVGDLLGFKGQIASTFEVVIQLGSILAVVVVFRKRILQILNLPKQWELIRDQWHGVKRDREPHLNLLHILVGMIPASILGALFSHFIKENLFSTATVIVGLVAGGILMIVAEAFRKARPTTTHVDYITYKQAFTVGLFQCLALWPGFSRSGSTISGGLLAGMNHKAASEYTFILAIPMMVAATGKDLLDNMGALHASDLPLFIVGFLSAFGFALLAIRFFLNLISKFKLTPFAYYRFVVAIIFALVLYV